MKQRLKSILTLAAAAVLFCCSFAQAQVSVLVTSFGQLQTAVTNFNNGTNHVTINVGANVVITSALTVSNSTNSLTIKSADGAGTKYALTRGILQTADSPSGLFTIDPGAYLVFENIVVDGNMSTFTSNSAPLVYVNETAWFTMRNGAVLRNNRSAKGGAVFCDNGTFVIDGGEIRGNVAESDGGGVYVRYFNEDASGTVVFDMSDFVIDGNRAEGGSGGGLFIENIVTNNNSHSDVFSMTMERGELTNNTAGVDGGGSYIKNSHVWGGSLRVDGVEITGNTAVYGSGGGMYTYGVGFDMSEGKINDNRAGRDGGGVCLLESSGNPFYMNKVEIINNTASSSGGGVYSTYSAGTFDMIDVEIINNTAVGGSGGGVYSVGLWWWAPWYDFGGPVNIIRCKINSNTARDDGGGIYLRNDAGGNVTYNIREVEIMNNTGNGSGGGLYLYRFRSYASSPSAVLNMSDFVITGNAAYGGSGGGLFIKDTASNYESSIIHSFSMIMERGEITNNTAGVDGGGSYIKNSYIWGGSLRVDGVEITGNTAVYGSGGGMYTYGVGFDMSEGKINDNRAGRDGGGVPAVS